MPRVKDRWGSVDVDTRVRQAGWIGPFGVVSDEPSRATYTPVCGMELPGGLCGLPAQHGGACKP